MCKQKGNLFCSVLGSDPNEWSRKSPLTRPPDFESSWSVFKEVIRLEFQNDLAGAGKTLGTDKGDSLRDWFDVHAQNAGEWRRKTLEIPKPVYEGDLDPVKTFSNFFIPILVRDNFRCRYCSNTILPRKRLRQLNQSLGQGLFPIGRRNSEMSGFYLVACATLDHVIPHSLGGRTDENNLVASCWPCNYGKMNYTLEQIGLDDPFSRQPLLPEFPIEILTGNK